MTRGLVTRGYLARKRTKGDARTYAVRLTDAGRQQLDRAGPIAKKVEIALLKQLPNRERAQFLQLLEAFATNAS
jgi:DNA-binding MarR family transcriptional regulator